MLRALGSRAAGLALFLGEAAALAAVGSAGGLLIGRLLANATVALTSTTVVGPLHCDRVARRPALHLVSRRTRLLHWRSAVAPRGTRAGARGITGAADGGDARRRPAWTQPPAFPVRSLACGVLPPVSSAGWLATLGPVSGLPLFGYASALVIVFGAVVPGSRPCCLPSRTARNARSGALLGVEDWLALANLAAAIPRLSISVAALAVSLSMMVAVAVMIGSFRETVDLLGRADAAGGPLRQPWRAAAGGPERRRLVRLESSTRCRQPGRGRGRSLPEHRGAVRRHLDRVGARRFRRPARAWHARCSRRPPTRARRCARAIGRDAVVVSESFAHQASASRRRRRDAAHAARPAALSGSPRSITTTRATAACVVMDRGTFVRHFGDAPPTGLSVYLKPGADANARAPAAPHALGETPPRLHQHERSLRAEVLRIFDSTFAITYALEIIAILVAILGVAGTLLTLILERRARAVAAAADRRRPRQIRRMVVSEAVLIGARQPGDRPRRRASRCRWC